MCECMASQASSPYLVTAFGKRCRVHHLLALAAFLENRVDLGPQWRRVTRRCARPPPPSLFRLVIEERHAGRRTVILILILLIVRIVRAEGLAQRLVTRRLLLAGRVHL